MWLELFKEYKTYEIDQIILPRYSDTVNPPCMNLCGNGPGTIIKTNKNILNLSQQKYKSIIQTEDFGKNTAQWSSGEYNRPDYLAAILRPMLKNFTLCGFDETNSNYTQGGVVNNQPWNWNPVDRFPDLYGGIFLQSTGCIVRDINLFYIPGTALWLTRSGAVNNGAIKQFDVEKNSVFDCSFERVYRGFDIQTIDSMVGRLQGHAARDYGIKFSAGSTQIDGTLHFWGIFPGPCVWFTKEAGACWGGPFYVENSNIGILLESSKNILGPIYSKDCIISNIKISGERNVIGPIDLDVRESAYGLFIINHFNKIIGGNITLPNKLSTGIHIEYSGGNGLIINNLDIIGIRGGIGLSAYGTLNNSRISLHLQNLDIGLDLNTAGTSRIGTNNTIDITHNYVSKPVSLPKTWHPSNRIYINGVQQQPVR